VPRGLKPLGRGAARRKDRGAGGENLARHDAPTDGTLAAASGAPPAQPRLETGLVLARRRTARSVLQALSKASSRVSSSRAVTKLSARCRFVSRTLHKHATFRLM